jgi:hypothetical protein
MTTEEIKQDFIQQKGLSEKEAVIGTVGKYAYYNPAQKDSSGNVTVGEAFPLIWLLGTLASAVILLQLLNYILIPSTSIPCAVIYFAGCIIYFVYFQKRQKMVVNTSGFTVDDQTYYWDNYTGIYLIFYAHVHAPKQQYANIVLTKADNSYTLVDVSRLSQGINFSKVATPLRDFQPKHYD